MDHYQEGRRAKQSFLTSVHYMHMPRNLSAVEGMKLFLPAQPEMASQMAMPHSKKVIAWMKGWNEYED